MTRREAKFRICATVHAVLRLWAQRGERLNRASQESLKFFAHDANMNAIRLSIVAPSDVAQSTMSVFVTLVPKDGEYNILVRTACACFSSSPKLTAGALSNWNLANELATAILRCADSLPPIFDEVAA